jgi:hypothetical protein
MLGYGIWDMEYGTSVTPKDSRKKTIRFFCFYLFLLPLGLIINLFQGVIQFKGYEEARESLLLGIQQLGCNRNTEFLRVEHNCQVSQEAPSNSGNIHTEVFGVGHSYQVSQVVPSNSCNRYNKVLGVGHSYQVSQAAPSYSRNSYTKVI